MYDKGPNCHQQGYLLITYRLLSDDASTSVSIRYQLVSLCIKISLAGWVTNSCQHWTSAENSVCWKFSDEGRNTKKHQRGHRATHA